MERRALTEVHVSDNQKPNPKAVFWRNRSRARTLRFFVPILIGVPVLVALGQQTQQPPPSPPISVDVKLVRISATVRDKHGKIVPTLNQDDFVLHVDGHLQHIDNFVRQSDLPLTLGLLVQTGLSPQQKYEIHSTSEAGYAFLDHMLRGAEDQAFVVPFGRKAELAQGLTSSRPDLQAALQLAETSVSSSERPVKRTLLYDAICLASNEMMKTQQGRKALFVLSNGIDHSSKATLEDAIEAAQRADTSVYSVLTGENLSYGPGGPQGPNGKKVLERISTETGGHPFRIWHGRPVAEIYAQAEEELRNEYVLGFVPTPANTGAGYHMIRLTTKQKGLTVQARDGYYSDQQDPVNKSGRRGP